MRTVPPEIESLIWSIAEAPTEKAVQEFHARYPAYAGELARRIATVHALRGAGKEAGAQRPAFTPRTAPSVPSGRSASWAAGLALAAVAVASFTFAIFARRKPEPLPTPVPHVNVAPPVLPKPKPYVLPPVDEAPSVANNDLGEGDEKPLRDETPLWARPRRVEMRGVGLVTALKAIAAGGGLKIVIGPGLPDPHIDVNYEGLNTVEILQRLGEDYAFTPFDQGNGSVIIVPARDETEKTTGDLERKRYNEAS